MRCWHQPLCSGFFSLQWRHRITMATRKHASPRRRNSSFRLRSKCMTFPRRKEDLIKWFFTSWNFCVDMLKRKTQLTANGFTVKAAMKNSVVSVRLILKCFNEQMRFFFLFVFFVLLLNVRRTQHMLQTCQKPYFSAAMSPLLSGHVCFCAPVAYQQITGGHPRVSLQLEPIQRLYVSFMSDIVRNMLCLGDWLCKKRFMPPQPAII